jgi:hypothetical protein
MKNPGMVRSVMLASLALLLSCGVAAAQNCNPLPNQLTNGTTADANQVMANFNSLLTCINNLPAGTNLFPTEEGGQ